MLELPVKRRVENLENLMADLLRVQAQTQVDLALLSQEMREFKDEMAEFKDEMREFKDEMAEFKDEMREFKDEMAEFKDEMREFKEESRLSRIEMNRKWGNLANKMGTLVEDLVAPSLPRILRETVGCPDGKVEFSGIRIRRQLPDGRYREFDVVAVCGEYVLINETKSLLDAAKIESFVASLPTARDFLPEFQDRKYFGVVASLYVDESLVRFGEKQGVYVLGFGEDVMEVLNNPAFTPQLF
jgi:hypothetical protein